MTTSIPTAPAATSRSRKRPRAPWLVPFGLILLSVIPLIFGALRLTELVTGAEITPANERYFVSPIPIVTHIIAVTLFSVLGALQFVPSLRRRTRWHRYSGRITLPAGLLAALTGLWMTLFYPQQVDDGGILYISRLVVGSVMTASIVLGFLAVLRRDFVTHSAWMTRAYAIGVGAGTQVVVALIATLVVGPTNVVIDSVLLGLAWVINLTIAEVIIHRRARPLRASRTSGRFVSA